MMPTAVPATGSADAFPVPPHHLLLAPTAWGIVLMPVSGFWALPVPAIIAIRSAHRSAGRPVTADRRSVLS